MGIGGFGMGEMIMIFMVVLLLFGAKRLPEIGSSLGKGIREFKSSVREIESELKVPPDPPRRVPPQAREEPESGEPKSLSGAGEKDSPPESD
ncbi:MAG: twin-arginine translocase TatA/TatE family subunit [Gemmatimonadota bacterium]|nr:twin-arginine translocase TatA/TatE family subunit [Gemmatimonadota bacterium]